MPNRDHLRDMTKAIDTFMPEDDYVASDLSAQLVAHLQDSDPALLTGWLNDCATILLAHEISSRRRYRVRAAVKQLPKDVFADAVAAHEAGDSTTLSIFAEHLVVNEKRISRAIGSMNRDDHKWVADSHRSRSKTALLKAAFHDAVAARIPEGQTTADVMNEETYRRLYDSIDAL
jgi:hypothetical protein